jgi:choline dehydrogenase-like flavoprotein
MTLDEALKQSWDAIVIGAGMGGGMAGRQLAERGLSVLFIEKGPLGIRSEQQGLTDQIENPTARRVRGFWPKPAEAVLDGQESTFFAPIGCGVGGTSVFYAGALERPERHDIEQTEDATHPTGGWPINYDQMRPYFEQAEQVLHIAGTQDPLSSEITNRLHSPLSISSGEQAMIDDFSAHGLHPYRQHIAIRNVEGCTRCVGIKCPKPCKMDGRSAGVEPALQTGKAALLTECDVRRVDATNGTVTGVSVHHQGREATLKAKTFLLAAGAFGSPRLLLLSGADSAKGLANSSDWVGRGLMFHLNELIAVWPRRGMKFEGASKSISLRDIYMVKGERLGMVQSMGLEASYGNIAYYLSGLVKRSVLRHIPKVKYLTNIAALAGAKMLGRAKIFVGIIEDFSYPENRVVVSHEDPERIAFTYSIPPELAKRRRMFRHQVRKLFKRNWTMLLGQTAALNFGHPCGTLRFGNDPATSVLDATCKTHDLDNLYVVDASFMPSSMGVNPSLTIAANAMRVADIIADRLRPEDKTNE